MSGPYDQYNQYNNQYSGGQQYPPQSHSPYPPQQNSYDQSGYQQQGYPSQQPSGQYYGGEQPQYNQQYGAPAHGGFQHGQQVAPYDQQQQQQG
jgi:hypothetical protein